MYKAPSFGLGIKKDLRESIESVYDINNTINEEEQLIISLFEKFLEENFHVEMLTEEDIDYVFENEFPQWLEESTRESRGSRNSRKTDVNDLTPQTGSSGGNSQNSIGDKKPTSKNKVIGKDADESVYPYADPDEEHNKTPEKAIRKSIAKAKEEAKKQASQAKPTPTAKKKVRRSAPKPQSFGALLRKVGGNAPATSDTAAGRRKIKLLDARAKARTAARDAIVRKTGRGQLSWAKKAFNPDGN